jgi:hypothetical protein
MNSDRLRRAVLIAGLLAAGVILSYLRPPLPLPESQTRQLLWEGRRSDLVIQLGLMLIGAFGIRALMPSSSDDEDSSDGPMD